MNLILFIKFIFRILKYNFSSTKRYAYLLKAIYISKAKSILEIGVYNGNRAKEMIETAKIFNKEIDYYGFDLFEDFYKKKNIIKKELSKKPLSKKEISIKLNNYNRVRLFKGDTKATLPKFVKEKIKIDFAFIDGGHSFNTINSDWKNINQIITKNSTVIFDDFYEYSGKVKLDVGCNKIINSLPKKKYLSYIYPVADTFFDKYNKIYKNIFMVRVKKND